MRLSFFLALNFVLISTAVLQAKSKLNEEPSEEIKWLRRAEEQTNLRTLEAKPFHLLVKFHAYPGMEFLPKEKQQIMTGDGTYEETWMGLHRWRREINFGAYHAVETDSGRARKMQASSDYEPVRVLMLLDSLLFPVDKNMTWPNPDAPHINWKTKRNSVPSSDKTRMIDFVQIYHSLASEECGYISSYLFLPDGTLVQRNDFGLAYGWQDQVRFGEKIAARHISIQAGGRDLVQADVTIEPAGDTSDELFDQPVAPAEPGMTLRPIHWGDARNPEIDHQGVVYGSRLSYLSVSEVYTRKGEIRELEMVDSSDLKSTKLEFNEGIRHARILRPPMIDNSPCEIFMKDAFVYQSCQH
jgi:hypothetical protein